MKRRWLTQSVLLACAACLSACGSSVPDTVKRDAITYEQFQQLAVGQAMAQVTGIVGHDPTAYKNQAVGDGTVELDEWVNADGSGAAVALFKGYVIALKAYGLSSPASPVYERAKEKMDAIKNHS